MKLFILFSLLSLTMAQALGQTNLWDNLWQKIASALNFYGDVDEKVQDFLEPARQTVNAWKVRTCIYLNDIPPINPDVDQDPMSRALATAVIQIRIISARLVCGG
ncbi:hypothetical protein GCK72_003327 [Caenorhabditis remanei]|uniref:Uncharacterized protein n=1 Tax=Caenorhabditis remanei TaxID=31234 RepID=A0A6A5HTF4_CAERE|nr:hypothetical protein GCK72_003327 [Caenorhabditis remanei]KAF1771500.1 hypothetical protein GCK72_003327 [Caenorhabditis remanei]